MKTNYYTGRGDDGTSALFGDATRLPKNSPIFELLGTLDELNCWLGLCRATIASSSLPGAEYIQPMLLQAQESLFTIQAQVAGADLGLSLKRVKELETHISRLTEGLPQPQSFYLPGASLLGSYFDIARTIARRCERTFIVMVQERASDTTNIASAYLNRLSSLLYALVRFANKQTHNEEQSPSYIH